VSAEVEHRNRFAQRLFSSLPARYDALEAFLSLGQNARWRREMVDHSLALAPSRVLDVATGTAGVAIELARRAPVQVVGLDLTGEMLARGQSQVDAADLSKRVRLVNARAEQIPFRDAAFDALTFTYLLRYVEDPAATLRELARVVRPGGVMASLEFFVPPHPFWRAWWRLYTRVVLPLGGLVAGGPAWWRVGRFLGPNIEQHYRDHPLDSLVDAWRRAGFDDVGVRVMSLGGGVVMWGTRRGG
jgi:demethylmenaquinone methyltransferase / 2-methoxy-6-polyprenyl-1,4-benzoquinol methylase